MVVNSNRKNDIEVINMVCIKSTAIIGDVLNMFATPSGGPAGVSYTIKFMKQVGNSSPSILSMRSSSGEQVDYQYIILESDAGMRITVWADGEYTCSLDNTLKSSTSEKCIVSVQEVPPMKYKCSGAPNYVCVQATDGIYNTLEECQAVCRETPPPTEGKFILQFNVSVLRDDIKGTYSADQVSQAVRGMIDKL